MGRHEARVAILGTGSYVPERFVSNDEVGQRAGVNDEWIRSKTGIGGRHWAAPDQATSDLATEAARRALESAGMTPADMNLVIVATSSPDHLQPPTAAYVQHNLQANNAAAFDMNAVCSGFVFALTTAARMIAGMGGHALVIGADIYSRLLNPEDKRTVILFGDGAGAVVIGPAREHRGAHGITDTELHTFGGLNDKIVVPAGGSRMPLEDIHHETGLAYFTMEGRAVKDFVLESLPPLVHQFWKDCEIDPAEVKHFVPHQANGMMIADLVPALGLTNAITHTTFQKYGNTGAASVGITLDQAARNGELKEDDTIFLAGFGGGMAAGLALLTW